jgi:predicted transposase/invertase (TIGR01784 family)
MTPIQLKPTDDLLNILVDPVFKAVFTRDTKESRGALMALISAYTGSEVAQVFVKQNEPAIEDAAERQIRFDISVKFNDGKLADVEMNMNALGFDLVRGEYYLGKLHTSQSIQGVKRDYADLKESWQISFLNNRTFFKDDAVIHRFEYYDQENNVSLGGLTHIVTVELDKAADLKEPTNLDSAQKWAYTFKYCPDEGRREEINKIMKGEEGIAMAMETLLTISADENERARLLTQEKNLMDWQSGINYARKEGREEGIKLGEQRAATQYQTQLSAQAAHIAELERQLAQTRH